MSARRRRKLRFIFGAKQDNAAGFSLIELLAVIAIALIATALIVPNMQTAIRGIRLNESSMNYANLLQQARMRSVQDDRYYTVLTATDPVTGVPYAFVDLQGTTIYVSGDPQMAFAAGVQPQSYSSGPGVTNLKSQFLPPGPLAQNSVNVTGSPTFGPRGLPCTPTPGPGGVTCGSITPTSYISFMQNTQGAAWQAVTVTPAGRIARWAYDGTTWSRMN